MPSIKMRLEMRYYSNDPEGRTELRLTDDSTGVVFVRLEMNARQFRDLLGGGGGVKVGVNLPTLSTIALLGSDMTVETIDIPRSVYANDPITRGEAEPPSVAAFAEAEQAKRNKEIGRDTSRVVHVETRNTNSGWKLIVRTYVLREDV